MSDGPTSALHDFAVSHSWLTGTVIVTTAICILACPAILIAAWLRRPQLRLVAATFLGLLLTDLACVLTAHTGFRDRPFVALRFEPLFPHSANTSFPSSTTAFAMTCAMVMLLAWRRAGIALSVGAVFVGFGCVYVGVHWVNDVLVGLVIGVGCGAISWLALGLRRVSALLMDWDKRLQRRRT